MERGVGMMAAGAQVQLEEVLPEAISPNSFLLPNIYFFIPRCGCTRFLCGCSPAGYGSSGLGEWTSPGRSPSPGGSPARQLGGVESSQGGGPGGASLAEGSQQTHVHRLPGLSRETRCCFLGSFYLTELADGCRPRPQHCVHTGADTEVVDTAHHLETSTE